jgi:phospholipid/cholesterol/gamma-HCH transport system ATP-binding protein
VPEVRQFMSGEADGPVPFHYPASDYHSELLGTDPEARR